LLSRQYQRIEGEVLVIESFAQILRIVSQGMESQIILEHRNGRLGEQAIESAEEFRLTDDDVIKPQIPGAQPIRPGNGRCVVFGELRAGHFVVIPNWITEILELARGLCERRL